MPGKARSQHAANRIGRVRRRSFNPVRQQHAVPLSMRTPYEQLRALEARGHGHCAEALALKAVLS